MKNPLFLLWRPVTAVALTALTLLSSCDPDKKQEPGPSAPSNVVYVVNEGTTNGAVSLINKTTKEVKRDIFFDANNVELGPIVQDMAIIGSKGYLVVNGSDKVEVVDMLNFKQEGSLTGLTTPRFITPNGTGKAYVTEWQGAYPRYTAGRVAVLDLIRGTIAKRIPVRIGPEQMLLKDNRLYVTNSYSDSLAIINTTTEVVESYVAMPSGSKNIVEDAAGNIWVLCSEFGTTTDYLVRFNPATPTQQTRISFPNSYENGNLKTNEAKNKIYVSLSTGTYELAPTATALPAMPLIARNFYGLGIDPVDNSIYGGTSSFNGDAEVLHYSPTGTLIETFDVAVGPNKFLFR